MEVERLKAVAPMEEQTGVVFTSFPHAPLLWTVDHKQCTFLTSSPCNPNTILLPLLFRVYSLNFPPPVPRFSLQVTMPSTNLNTDHPQSIFSEFTHVSIQSADKCIDEILLGLLNNIHRASLVSTCSLCNLSQSTNEQCKKTNPTSLNKVNLTPSEHEPNLNQTFSLMSH